MSDVTVYEFNLDDLVMHAVHERDAAARLQMSVPEVKLLGLDCVRFADGIDYFDINGVKAEMTKRGIAIGEMETV